MIERQQAINQKVSNRQQYTSLKKLSKKEYLSKRVSNGLGVPQDEVLSPILFNLFINCIILIFNPNAHVTIYVDGISVVVSNKSDEILKSESQEILKTLNYWFSAKEIYSFL